MIFIMLFIPLIRNHRLAVENIQSTGFVKYDSKFKKLQNPAVTQNHIEKGKSEWNQGKAAFVL